MTSWQDSAMRDVDMQQWHRLRSILDENVDTSIKQQGLVENYYLPLFFYLFQMVSSTNQMPMIVGINAPQGGGKSTLTHYLVQLFKLCDLKAVTLSIDDFYLTYKDQLRIAREYPDNIYLQQRGYPGTHDIELGVETLSILKNPQSAQNIALPRYDKSRHQGQGDRAEFSLWPKVRLPVDIVFVEGWMLGFRPLPSSQISDPHLSKINTLLENYQGWHQFLDNFIYIYPQDPVFVVDWRTEAEERMKAQGLSGMSLTEVRSYAEKFLPAYRLYGPPLHDDPPSTSSFLKIQIGKNRLPTN